jgi:hypothetical protein
MTQPFKKVVPISGRGKSLCAASQGSLKVANVENQTPNEQRATKTGGTKHPAGFLFA